jgi:putative transcriptional regulator
VNAIETGKFDPSLLLAFRIARLFDQAIEDICSDAQAMEVSSEWKGHGNLR